jgi:hypothetical protein
MDAACNWFSQGIQGIKIRGEFDRGFGTGDQVFSVSLQAKRGHQITAIKTSYITPNLCDHPAGFVA